MPAPRSTYRVQLTHAYTLRDAAGLADYLADLGVSHLYASPIFAARPGSDHGYDAVDPRAINPELGGREALERLSAALRKRGLGWLQDFVPNHMAYHPANPYLMDVLENGPTARYAHWFDIDWKHEQARFQGRVLAPMLGRHYADALERGELRLGYDARGFGVSYFDLRLPLRPESYTTILKRDLDQLRLTLERDEPALLRYQGVIHTLESLPAEGVRERYDQVAFAKHLLWDLHEQEPRIRALIDANVGAFNGRPGEPSSFDALDALLSEQYYRLAFWKVATEEINYRRFFTVNDLISLAMDDERVFGEVHELLFALLREGIIDGIRIDHLDGLWDPSRYLRRLRQQAPEAWIVIEKILDPHEELPRPWPIAGTTGYDFLNLVCGLFCQRDNAARMDRIYRRAEAGLPSLPVLVTDMKRLHVNRHMAGDVANLAHLLLVMSGPLRYGNDFTHIGLLAALTELLAAFPVYRTYLPGDDRAEEDATYVRRAMSQASRAVPELAPEVAYIGAILLDEGIANVSPEQRGHWHAFTRRFEQLTGPLMAKGFEDTALYRFNRLLALNDVGSDPQRFGVSDIEMHHQLRQRAANWPATMNATASHDTKRGEDARMRLCVLSELPEAWGRALRLWQRLCRRFRKRVGGRWAPSRNEQIHLFQTLLGTFPFEGTTDAYVERVAAYFVKALREAKIHSGWLNPDTAWEDACVGFVRALLARGSPFLPEFRPLQLTIARDGIWNSLAQVAIKLTAPGVPDIYQGCELWDFSMVDPDNRRPVDYRRRRGLLRDLTRHARRDLPGLLRSLLADPEDPRIKLFLLWRLLHLRAEEPDLFARGEYVMVEKAGARRDSVIAFARHFEGRWALTVVPRLLTGFVAENDRPLGPEVWQDTSVRIQAPATATLPTRWRNTVTGEALEAAESLSVGDLLAHFPAAVLVG